MFVVEIQEKILVINLLHIGDVVLSTPFLQALRDHYPQAEIKVLVDTKTMPVLQGLDCINEIIKIDKKGYHNKLHNYLWLAWMLRKERFTTVINLHANERATFLAVATGAKRIVGYATWGLRNFFSYLQKKNEHDKHVVDSNREILENGLGAVIEKKYFAKMVVVREKMAIVAEKWQAVFSEIGVSGMNEVDLSERKVVALNVGGTWPTKRWSTEHFAELIVLLQSENVVVAMLGSPMDRGLVNSILRRLPLELKKKVAIFTGMLDLQELAGVLQKCSLLISNDSGPAHMAAAVGIPVVTIFGPSSWQRYAPYGKHCVSLHLELPCQPCGKHECILGGHECMRGVKPEMLRTIAKQAFILDSVDEIMSLDIIS